MPKEEKLEIKERKKQPCGCVHLFFTNGKAQYKPCFACAISNAGLMLQAAGDCLREQAMLKKAGSRMGSMGAGGKGSVADNGR